MIDRLVLTPGVREELFSHAREGSPNEICGVLGGERVPVEDSGADEAEYARITTIRAVTNVADDPRFRYDLDPAETVECIEALEGKDLDHIGFYHSHPEGPRGPSRTDEARATWPGYVYLIVSLGDEPVIGAWRWSGNSFVQLPVDTAEA